jgi:hypothetical protein
MILLLFLLIALATICYPQEYEYVPFPTSGAIWSEAYQPPLDINGNLPPPILERFALTDEDTVINEHTYKKLYIFYDTVFNPSTATPIGGIREDDQRRVYYKGGKIHDFKPMNEFVDYEEIMLFDFSVSIGDTIKEGNFMFWDEGFWLVVQDIDTIQVGGTLRKRYCFHPNCESFGIYAPKWIEGMGCIRGLLFTSGATPTNALFNYLICFKHNDEILYFNDDYSECMPPIVGVEAQGWGWNKLNVFPNPVNGKNINFDLGEAQIELITIYNAKGSVVDRLAVKRPSSTYSHSHNLPKGIYFIVAIDRNGERYNGKFVVQ